MFECSDVVILSGLLVCGWWVCMGGLSVGVCVVVCGCGVVCVCVVVWLCVCVCVCVYMCVCVCVRFFQNTILTTGKLFITIGAI